MQYKEYGKTGKKVSILGFGGMRFRKEDYDKDPEISAAVVRKASELGVNYFDTAPFYCDDRSEEIFGLAFKKMPNPFYVSTKSNVNSEATADQLRRKLETSLGRLGVSKINFYHMWCILTLEQYRRVIAPGGPYWGALKAKEEGLIDHIVFSSHCSGAEIAQIIRDGYFEGVTLGYNILNFPFRQEGLKAAFENGLGVATMNPLGGGLLAQKAAYFDFIRGENDANVTETALRFNASHPEITVVLSGMGTVTEVEQNVRILSDFQPMSVAQRNAIADRLSGQMDQLCTGCQYCLGCPQEIKIPKYMMAYNQRILDGAQRAIDELKWHWGINNDQAKTCIACGLCESRCTQHLPIIERLQEIAGWTL